MPPNLRLRLSLILLLFIFSFPLTGQRARTVERGELSVYFMQEKIGYEEYVWEESVQGYSLSVKGRMNKPAVVEVDRLKIELDRNFIPLRYSFRGSIGGVQQEISSEFSDGTVRNTLRVNRQQQSLQSKVRRDALLLPNPFFSPYLVIAKKYGCALEEKINLSAYIVPQLETPCSLEPSVENPCLLLMLINATEIELVTNESGHMVSLQIPAQNLRVTNIISGPN